ncbi:hypothetical protein ACJZRZ_003210 [Vibrio parahaemolyticus]
MKVMNVILSVGALMLVGCSNYHIEQNSRNGLKCAEQEMRGNTIVNTKCDVHIDGSQSDSSTIKPE